MDFAVNRIIHGDVLGELKKFPDETIGMVISSPPYYGLRDYGTATWEGGDKKCDHKIPEIELDKLNKNNNSHSIRFNRDKCHKGGGDIGKKIIARYPPIDLTMGIIWLLHLILNWAVTNAASGKYLLSLLKDLILPSFLRNWWRRQ